LQCQAEDNCRSKKLEQCQTCNITKDVKVTLNSNTIPIGSKATQSVFIKKTIGELKEQFGIDRNVALFMDVRKNTKLENNKTLEDYGMRNGDTIETRMSGGSSDFRIKVRYRIYYNMPKKWKYKSLEVRGEMKVIDLKKEIKDKCDIPVKTQILTYNGEIMKNHKTMEDYGVEPDGKITVEDYPYAYKINVFIQEEGEKRISVNDDMTVKELKDLILSKFGIRQYPRLWFNGEKLSDDQCLRDLDMDEDDEVYD